MKFEEKSHYFFLSLVQCLNPGCVINQARWTDDWTALHIAAMMGAERIVDLLLAAGADPELRNDFNESARDLAKAQGLDI